MELPGGWRLLGRSLVQQVVSELMVRLGHGRLKGSGPESVRYPHMREGAKFEVGKFDGTGNFGLWQRMVKDLMAQKGLSKALRENKSDGMDQLDWEEKT
ncbi:hypothetical protein Lal_00041852 [Lupinus albus]|nr:hypothetical protein Lal_00041852 [Lupinus albus]